MTTAHAPCEPKTHTLEPQSAPVGSPTSNLLPALTVVPPGARVPTPPPPSRPEPTDFYAPESAAGRQAVRPKTGSKSGLEARQRREVDETRFAPPETESLFRALPRLLDEDFRRAVADPKSVPVPPEGAGDLGCNAVAEIRLIIEGLADGVGNEDYGQWLSNEVARILAEPRPAGDSGERGNLDRIARQLYEAYVKGFQFRNNLLYKEVERCLDAAYDRACVRLSKPERDFLAERRDLLKDWASKLRRGQDAIPARAWRVAESSARLPVVTAPAPRGILQKVRDAAGAALDAFRK